MLDFKLIAGVARSLIDVRGEFEILLESVRVRRLLEVEDVTDLSSSDISSFILQFKLKSSDFME